jgi:hypothetical protein
MEPGQKAMEETAGLKYRNQVQANVEKRNSSKDQTVLEKSLDELESMQMEDEVKNVLVT